MSMADDYDWGDWEDYCDMNEHPDYISVYKPVAGWKAILYTWDDKLAQYVPWSTGFFAYGERGMAVADAIAWAEAEEIQYVD